MLFISPLQNFASETELASKILFFSVDVTETIQKYSKAPKLINPKLSNSAKDSGVLQSKRKGYESSFKKSNKVDSTVCQC